VWRLAACRRRVALRARLGGRWVAQVSTDPFDGLEAMSQLFLIVVVAIALVASVRRTTGPERLLVLRLGSIHRLAGPGISLVAPVMERAVRINLDEVESAWPALSREELLRRVTLLVSQPGPAPADWPENVPYTLRWIRSIAAYLLLLSLALASAHVFAAAGFIVARWLSGNPPSSLSELLDGEVSREAFALLMLGFSIGVFAGGSAAVWLIRFFQLIPERTLRKLLHGPLHPQNREGPAK